MMPFDLFSRRRLLLSGAGLVFVAGAPLALRAQGAEEAPAAEAATEGSAPEVVEMALGDPDAPVTVVEYASFTCPHCAAFHAENFPRLKEQYIDPGQVRFIFREVYFDRPGLWAAMIARCAGEDRYFGVVDLLFENQGEWSRATEPQAIVEGLYSIGRQAGLNREAMDACLQDQAFAQALVARYQEHAAADAIQSTPSFVIDGEKTSNLPWDEFQSRLDAALAS
jgi:protein-disulfide isomerase